MTIPGLTEQNLPVPQNIGAYVENDNQHGMMIGVFFTKMGDGRLQISLASPARGPSAIMLTADQVPELVKTLIANFMVQPLQADTVEARDAATAPKTAEVQ